MCSVATLFTNGILCMSEDEEVAEESLTTEFVYFDIIYIDY
jgi:hypothetical protein